VLRIQKVHSQFGPHFCTTKEGDARRLIARHASRKPERVNNGGIRCQHAPQVRAQFCWTLRLWHLFLDSFFAHFLLAHRPAVSLQRLPVDGTKHGL
jgi:hypothetical protein